MGLCDDSKIEIYDGHEEDINDSIRIDKGLLVHIDSLLSLVCSNRFTSNIPQNIIQDISHTTGKIRKLYKGK